MAAAASFAVNVNGSLLSSATYPLLTLAPAAGHPIEIVAIELTAGASSSGITEVELIRSAAQTAYTGGTSAAGTLIDLNHRAQTPGTASLVFSAIATGGGPTIESLKRTTVQMFGMGWPYIPVPEARYRVAGGGLFGIRFPTLASLTYNLCVQFLEY